MMLVPYLPDWESLHPLVIHFPIVLLLLSPAFVLTSAVLSPQRGRAYLIVGLALLLTGTGSLFLAVETGEAAAELADHTPGMTPVLQAHEQLASQTRMLFSGLSFLLVALFVLPHFSARPLARIYSTVLPMVFLALYLTGALALVNTAHQGGRLVHQFGVHAMITH
ncbi:DUF2231 domain-containing protein [Occallatibacter riparius]|uniref:DUF2231 domain-containing protein n=1 Tax=Occallatibacter riparius TaxID=1002689 RepID=A0A9J7BPF4_9BACT|nr:DUF2231 domain-containing protein [Occallatibacter riparius]UWZ84592.1 hypothetical protein MOP44_01345 [Occallatibacter riparius]